MISHIWSSLRARKNCSDRRESPLDENTTPQLTFVRLVRCDQHTMCANTVRDLLHGSSNVFVLLKIHESFRAHLLGQRFLLLTAVNHDRSHTHSFGKLHALDANASTATWEDDPIARFQSRIDERSMHRRSTAHDRPCDVIRHSVGDSTRIVCGTSDVLLIRPIRQQAGMDASGAIVLSAVPALLAVVAHTPQRLDATPVSYLPARHVLAHLYNHASTFMSGTTSPKRRHGRHSPVVRHEVDVGHAQTGGVQA
nr:hypothetical protein CFP56_68327 [Quercus suber]